MTKFRVQIIILTIFLITSSFIELKAQDSTKKISDIEEKKIYIIPRIGISTLTGNFGLEVQYKHIAFDTGILQGSNIKHYLTTGFKYYFNPYRSSLYIGAGWGTALTKKEENTNVVSSHLGIIFGYRIRFEMGLEFSLGIGPLFSISDGNEGPPMLDLVVGYSF